MNPWAYWAELRALMDRADKYNGAYAQFIRVRLLYTPWTIESLRAVLGR